MAEKNVLITIGARAAGLEEPFRRLQREAGGAAQLVRQAQTELDRLKVPRLDPILQPPAQRFSLAARVEPARQPATQPVRETLNTQGQAEQVQRERQRLVEQVLIPVRLGLDNAYATLRQFRAEAGRPIRTELELEAARARGAIQGLRQQASPPLTTTLGVDARRAEETLTRLHALAARSETFRVTADVRGAQEATARLMPRPAVMPIFAQAASASGEVERLSSRASRQATMPVAADTAQAQARVGLVQRQATMPVAFQVAADTARSEAQTQALRRMAGQPLTFQVAAETTGVRRELARLRDVGAGVRLPVQADTSQALAALRALQQSPLTTLTVTAVGDVRMARAALQSLRAEAEQPIAARAGGGQAPAMQGTRYSVTADTQSAGDAMARLRADASRGVTTRLALDTVAAYAGLERFQAQARQSVQAQPGSVRTPTLAAATMPVQLGQIPQPQAKPVSAMHSFTPEIRQVTDALTRLRADAERGVTTRLILDTVAAYAGLERFNATARQPVTAKLSGLQAPAFQPATLPVRPELAGQLPSPRDTRVSVQADIKQAEDALLRLRANASKGSVFPIYAQIRDAEAAILHLRQMAGRGASLPIAADVRNATTGAEQARQQLERLPVNLRVVLDKQALAAALQELHSAQQQAQTAVPAGRTIGMRPEPQQRRGLDAGSAAELRRRMEGVGDEFKTVSTKRGQLGEMWKGAIGDSGADDAITKLQAKLTDALRKLGKQTLTIDADPGPALGSLRKIRGDLETLKSTASAASAGMLAGFQRAGDGLLSMSRGLTLLSAGKGSLEDVARSMMKLQAIVDIGRGLSSLVTGLAGGAQNLARWTETMRAGSAMGAQFSAASQQVELALQKQGFAANAAAQGVSRTVAPTAAATQQTRQLGVALQGAWGPTVPLNAQLGRLAGALQQEALHAEQAARANDRLTASHLAGADAAAVNRGANGGVAGAGPAGAFGGRFAGARGALGFAAVGGAMAAGGTLAAGGSAGDAAGAGFGGAAIGLGSQLLMAKMLAPKAVTTAAAAASTATGAAAPAAAAGTGAAAGGTAAGFTMGAGPIAALIASVAVVGANIALKNDKVADWAAKKAPDWMLNADWIPRLEGTKKAEAVTDLDAVQKQHETTKQYGKEFAGKKPEEIQAEQYRRQLAQGDWLKEFAPQGFRTIKEEERAEQRQQVRRPIDERQRQLRDLGARQGDMVTGQRVEDRRYLEASRLDQIKQKASENIGESAKDATPGKMLEVWKSVAQVQQEINAGSKGSVQSEVAKIQAASEYKRALTEQGELQKKLAGMQQKAKEGAVDRSTHAEMRETADLLAAAQQRTLDASLKITAATREQSLAERQRIDGWKSWASDAQKFYTDLAKQERERLKGLQGNFGLQSAEDRKRALSVGQTLKGNLDGKGRDLTKEELDFAKGQELLSPLLKQLGERTAEKDPAFKELLKITGQDAKAREAESAATKFGEIKVALENKITAEIKVNEQGIVDQLGKQVLPQIAQMNLDLEAKFKLEMQKLEADLKASRTGLR